MSADAIVRPTEQPQYRRFAAHRYRGRWFFAGLSSVAACTVLVGFARTYYLKALFSTPTLPLVFHLHAMLFTAWMILFLVQTFLVARGRVGVHRRLGGLAALLLPPMLVSGVVVAIAAARGGGPVSAAVRRGDLDLRLPQPDPLQGLVVPLTSLALFAAFAASGLGNRRTPESHKRFMALAAIAVLPTALGRALATTLGSVDLVLFFGLSMLFLGLLLGAMVIHDRRSLGRLHPVTLWGGLLLLASFPARGILGRTGLWLTFARWLTGSE